MEPAVGEAWAYRARRRDSPVEVIVVRIGVRKPRRLLVRFVADDFEGRQDWVPPSRLKAAWRDLDAFIAREIRWEGVAGESPAIGSPEESAAGVVFDLLVDPGLATLGYNATCGVTRISPRTRSGGGRRMPSSGPGSWRSGDTCQATVCAAASGPGSYVWW
jgi:hypothetical protein